MVRQVQQQVQQHSIGQHPLWLALRRLASESDAATFGELGHDQLVLSTDSRESLFGLPPKGTLGLNNSGPDVARLQQALRHLGYYLEPTNTGVFGLMTALAIKNFQHAYGLPQIAEVGSAMRSALADALAGRIHPIRRPESGMSGWSAPVIGNWDAPTAGTWQPPLPGPSMLPYWSPSPPPEPSISQGLPSPNSYFISQVYDPRFNPYASYSTANCGPASLAMVLKALGKAPAHQTQEDLIDQVRFTMTGRVNDGELTNENQVVSAARHYGLRSARVSSVAEIESQLQRGSLVILAGNPSAYNYALKSDQYFPFSGGHFIVVSAVEGNRVVINDPLSHVGALVIDRMQLADYMAYKNWNSGMALSQA